MKRVIIDTDPGIDDAAAILFALTSGKLQVEALTTVFGNAEVEQCSRNALKILEVAERNDIPVYQGVGRPLLREPRYATHVHGDNGLGDVEFTPPTTDLAPGRGVEQIVSRIMESPGEITLIALGPLTNVALAVSLEPRIAENVAELILMGGAVFTYGNASPVASANMLNDPEAASIVYRSGMPLTQIGLDVCRPTLITDEHLSLIKAAHTPVTEFLMAITPFIQAFERRLGRISQGVHYNDVPAIAYALDPDLFTSKRFYVEIETKGEVASGQTAADIVGMWRKEPNANVCLEVDARGVADLFAECVARSRTQW